MIKFDTIRTAVFANWLRTRAPFIIGYTSDETGATIITREDLWVPADQIVGEPQVYAFKGKTECFAINVMKAFIREFKKLEEEAEAVPATDALAGILLELVSPETLLLAA